MPQGDLLGVMVAAASRGPLEPAAHDPSMPAALNALVAEATDPNSARRPEDGSLLTARLEAILEAPGPSARERRRRRLAALGGGVFALLGGLAGGLLVLFGGHTPPPPPEEMAVEPSEPRAAPPPEPLPSAGDGRRVLREIEKVDDPEDRRVQRGKWLTR